MSLEYQKEIALPSWSLLERLVLAVFVTSGVILAYGYHFPHQNHYVEVPPILSMLDASLFSKDYFVQELLHFTPRTYYNYLIYLLARIGFGIPLAFFVVYVVALASFVFGLQAIARNFCQSRVSWALLPFWGLSVVAGLKLGHNWLFLSVPLPKAYAMGLTIWGIYFSLRRAWPIAYAFFGIACLLQFLVGFLPALMIGPLLLLDTCRTRRWLHAVLAFSLLAIGAGLVYIPMLMQNATSTGLLTNQDFVELYGFIGHPFHMVPSTWGRDTWVQFLLFYTGGILCLRQARSLNPMYRFGLIVVVGTMFLGLVVNFIFVEVWPAATVVKLQFARMTPFAELAILIGLTVLFDEHVRKRNWGVCLPLVVIPISHHPGLLLLLFALGLGACEKLSQHLRAKSDLWLAIIIVVGLYQLPLSYSPLAWAPVLIKGPVLFGILLMPHVLSQRFRRERTRMSVAVTLAVVMAGTLVIGISGLLPGRLNQFFAIKVAFNQVEDDEISKLAIRFRALSLKDALVLIPPSVYRFKLLSQRSVVVDFKHFPPTDRGILEWKNRFEAILGVPLNKQSFSAIGWDRSNSIYRSRLASDLVKVAQYYRADYIMSRHDWHPNLPGQEVDREGAWAIWKIPNQERL